jgi:hypothetical protein
MQKVATMDKTDAEQSAWESYLADLEQDEVIDMPEEVYDQWEEVTTKPNKKTPKKKTSKKGTSKKQTADNKTKQDANETLDMMKQHSKEENIRAYEQILGRIARQKDVIDNYDNYIKV